MKTIEYTLGKTVRFVCSGLWAKPCELVVCAIGRKWVSLRYPDSPVSRYRVEIGSVEIDGGEYSSPGRVYESEAAYREEQELRQAWDKFAGHIANHRHRVPAGMTQEKIAEATRILGSDP